MTPGESIARCHRAYRRWLIAREWYECGPMAAAFLVVWHCYTQDEYEQIIREHGRRR